MLKNREVIITPVSRLKRIETCVHVMVITGKLTNMNRGLFASEKSEV